MKVSMAEFINSIDTLADKASSEPVVITRDGRDDLVLLPAEEYARLKRRDRRVVRLEEFTDEEMKLISKAETSIDNAYVEDPPEPKERLMRTMKTHAPWE